ncbi:MAG: 4-hydroxy-3-methylbut-2-enyl diphosphate reductase [Candidatus Sumerlaeia bacterium]
MKVIRAAAMGMCFGVRDALEVARGIVEPAEVTIYGELVHNEAVTRELAGRGFRVLGEAERKSKMPVTPKIMITAHGISKIERLRMSAAGYELIDTTCPLVRRAHEAARELAAMGCFVLVIGRRGHVEVEGIVGDLKRHEVIESAAEARQYGEPFIGVLCQTTTAPAVAGEIIERIRLLNAGSQIHYAPTICRATMDRQAAVRSLLARVEALVVVGGRKSNNTIQLAEMARGAGKPCALVTSADEVDAGWLAQFETVGLTAGTSTPDEAIEAVHRRMVEIARETDSREWRQAV